MKTLYQEVEKQLNAHLPQEWHMELRRRLSLLVNGIMLSESCSPRHMAQALFQYGLSTAQEASIERQIRRIENDERLNTSQCVDPFVKHHLAHLQEVVMILDATTHTDRHFLLMVSVRYRGRALPIAWQLWPANKPLKGAGFWKRVGQLLASVADILPKGAFVTWLADRAFGTPRFTDQLQAYGWHFVVRVQGQTRFRDQIGREYRLDELAAGRKRRRFKGCGSVFKACGWRSLSVVCLHAHHRSGPLCLVSDLAPDWHLRRLYRFRYNIEALFRDYKSQGWHWENNQVYDLTHTQTLLVGLALATWLTLMVGTQVAHELLCRPSTGQRRTSPPKRSLFALGLARLKQWAVGNGRRPLAFWLTDWLAPNWHDQLLQHHRYAYVMGTMSSIVKLHRYLHATVRP